MLYSVTVGNDIPRARFGAAFYPQVSYLLRSLDVEQFKEYEKNSGFTLISESVEACEYTRWQSLSPEERATARTLLVFNTGKIGDQLWTSAVIRAIKKLYPRLAIDVICENDTYYLWASNPDVRSGRLLPTPSESIHAYDACLFFDDIVSSRKDAEQKNCYEILFEEAGIPFDAELARPFVYPKYEDDCSIYSLVNKPDENGQVRRTRGHFVVGLHSSSEVRDLSDAQLFEFIVTLCKSTQSTVYGLSLNERSEKLQTKLALLRLENYVPCHAILNLSQIAALCHYAACVISVDTMLLHMAASQQTACVAIMSTVPPEQRVNYPFTVPVYKPCKYGSCFYKHPKFVYQIGDVSEYSKCYTPARVQCDVTKSVTIADIFAAINSAMKLKGPLEFTDLPQ